MQSLRDKTLVLRAEAGPRIGAGHFMRCLALGQRWTEAGGRVAFITATREEILLSLAEREGFEVHPIPAAHPDPRDGPATVAVLRDQLSAWVALDGYAFDVDYHRRVAATGRSLLCIDDIAHLSQYAVDVVLNQNAHAPLLRYVTSPHTRRLLGLPYVLLRREFRRLDRPARDVAEVGTRLLVTLGWADPANVTDTVLQALARVRLPEMECIVLVGPAHPRRADLEHRVGKLGGRIVLKEPVENMAALMQEVDLAITSGGTVVWELARVGVPALVLETRPQEEMMGKGLERVGLFHRLGRPGEISVDSLAAAIEKAAADRRWRGEMARRGPELVDGLGCERVIQEFTSLGE